MSLLSHHALRHYRVYFYVAIFTLVGVIAPCMLNKEAAEAAQPPLLTSSTPVPVEAASPFPSANSFVPLSIELRGGSTGIGLGIVHHFKSDNDLRLALDSFGRPFDVASDDTLLDVQADLHFHAHLKLSTLSLVYDQHIHHAPLYASGGFVVNSDTITATSIAQESHFIIRGGKYDGTAFGPVLFNVQWAKIAPYLGLGWQAQHVGQTNEHAGTRIDAGILFQGSPHVKTAGTGIVAANPAIFDPYLDAFAKRVSSRTEFLRLFPVVRISVPIGR